MGYGRNGERSNPLPEKTTRRREVFPTGEIPHLWAHAKQDAARNAGGTLYFKGATIYSYRDSWPLARIYSKPYRGNTALRHPETLVLSNSRVHGPTTSGHQGQVNRAVSHLQRVAVPLPTSRYHGKFERAEHEANLAYLADVAAGALKKAQRCMKSQRVGWQRQTAGSAITAAGRYMDFFGIRRKRPTFPELEWNAAAARAERIENPDPESADARQRAAGRRKELHAQRERDALASLTDHINAARTAWRLGEPLRMPAHPLAKGRYGYEYRVDPGPVMLRVEKDEIVTSMGARIPVKFARSLWTVIEGARTSGEVYDGAKYSRALKAGGYPVDRINADGTLVVGCHTIPHSELRMMARALGLV